MYPDEDNKQQIDNGVKTDVDGKEAFAPNNIIGEISKGEEAEADDAPEAFNTSNEVLPEPAGYESKPANDPLDSGINLRDKWLRSMGIFVIAAMALLILFAHRHGADGDAFSDYVKLSSDGCTIFSADRKHSPSEIKGILSALGLSCVSNEVIYFTASPMNTRLNLMYCPVYNKSNQNCRSLTVMKKIKVK
ncbi:hypothetical protein ACQFN5_21830 [Klebsiella sp. WOUb02]|uniref:hypothetical protein n=1 Tax=Klebsiella sp. WOUb02 TaxID=3161071 RepID=UPI003CEAE9BA